MAALTVREFIAKLQTCDPEKIVLVADWSDEYNDPAPAGLIEEPDAVIITDLGSVP